MKKEFLLFFCLSSMLASAQELFVFTEPASNMPAHTMTAKFSAGLNKDLGKLQQRYTPEIMFGFSKKFMLHVSGTFANMYSSNTRPESVSLYGKYRFLSLDEVHRHFRMAFFTEASYSRNETTNDEINLKGERSGVEVGIVATQLINKFAASATISNTQVLEPARFATDLSPRTFQSLNYTLSAGFLLLPKEYKNYNQLNVNFYTELLGQKTLDKETYFIDLAPAVQLIFNSNSKLNLGYRFQLGSNQERVMKKSFMLSFEHTFFNVL